MPVSVKTYEQVALEDPEGQWELACDGLRKKPAMTTEHGSVVYRLIVVFARQLDERHYVVSPGIGRLRVSGQRYYVPDLYIMPRAYERRLRERPRTFEVYDEPVPLVVEVWSPSTGGYDVTEKLREYQLRGDAEIWLIHPYDRTLTAWRRQPDGGYAETRHTGGTITPVALPDVTIAIEPLFD